MRPYQNLAFVSYKLSIYTYEESNLGMDVLCPFSALDPAVSAGSPPAWLAVGMPGGGSSESARRDSLLPHAFVSHAELNRRCVFSFSGCCVAFPYARTLLAVFMVSRTCASPRQLLFLVFGFAILRVQQGPKCLGEYSDLTRPHPKWWFVWGISP